MALFDIMDEVSRRQAMKTPLGEERIFGAVIGIVISNYNEKQPGRLGVSVPIRDELENQLVWARVAVPYGGSKWGQHCIPEKNDQVILIFEDGNVEKPFVIGSIPRENDSFLKKSLDEDNTKKQLMTRNGSRITFEDDKEAEGGKDKITISTAGNAHQFILDNEHKKIIVSDKENNCHVEMATENGSILIQAAKDLELQVGDSIKIKMKGDSGTVQIEAKKLKIEASDKIGIQTDGNAKLEGAQLELAATSSWKGSSSGIVILEGKPIKMGS